MTDTLDPKGLIREAYRIDGIGAGECRSIFLDWALGVPEGANPRVQIEALLERHESEPADHPMTQTLRNGLAPPARPKRRGGWSGRRK